MPLVLPVIIMAAMRESVQPPLSRARVTISAMPLATGSRSRNSQPRLSAMAWASRSMPSYSESWVSKARRRVGRMVLFRVERMPVWPIWAVFRMEFKRF